MCSFVISRIAASTLSPCFPNALPIAPHSSSSMVLSCNAGSTVSARILSRYGSVTSVSFTRLADLSHVELPGLDDDLVENKAWNS